MAKQNAKLNFLWLLVLLPLLFVFTACGSQFDTEAKCDTSGNYTTSTYSTFDGVLGNQSGGVFYRVTINSTQSGTNESYYLNGIVSHNQFALKEVVKDGDTTTTTYYYYTVRQIGNAAENVVYMLKQQSGQADIKGWIVAPYDAIATLNDIAGTNMSIGGDPIDMASPRGMLQALGALYDGQAANLDVSQNGNHFKFVDKTNAFGTNVKLTAYVNFDGNKMLQAYEGVIEPVSGAVGGPNSTIVLEEVSVKIAFPSFDGYEEIVE